MRLARFFPLFFLLPAAVALCAPAHAAPPTSFVVLDREASDRADELVKRGIALAKADKYAEAEPLVREAWGLKHAYDIAANLGIVEAALGKWRDAAEHLAYALGTFPANGKPEHKKLLEQTLAKATAQVAAVRIKVSADRAEVFVDGKSVGFAPLQGPVFVDPGSRTVEAKLSGFDPASQVADVKKGDASEIALTLKEPAPPVPTALPVATTPPPLQLPPPHARPLWPVAVSAGAAAIALGFGVGLTVAANGKGSDVATLQSTLKQSGGSYPCAAASSAAAKDCQTLRDNLASRDTLSSAALASYLVSGAAAAATVGLAVWAVGTPKDSKDAKQAVRVVPVAGAGLGGVVVVGRW